RLAAALPQTEEGVSRSSRRWSVAGRAFAWERPFSKADLRRYGDETPPAGPVLATRVEDLGEKEAVLAEGHDAGFTIPHLDGYPIVLVALEAADDDVVARLVEDAWLACAPRRLAEQYVARRRAGGAPS